MKLTTRQFVVLLLPAFSFIPSAAVDYTLPRSGSPFCAYLSKQIFCYGGYIPTANTIPFVSLNIDSFTGTVPTDTLNSQWSTVIPTIDNVVAVNRFESQGIALHDDNTFIIQGGYNYDATYLPNQTIVYNTANNTWTSGPDFTETVSGNLTTRQIYGATAVYLPASNSVAYYGGNQQHVSSGYVYSPSEDSNYTISQITYADPNAPDRTISDVGFFYVSLLNLENMTWSPMKQTTNNQQLVYGQTATFHPRSSKIYYIGGMFIPIDGNNKGWNYSPLSVVQYFDTYAGSWAIQNISNSAIPSPRIYHTANLMPNGNDIIIYGGSNINNTAVSDYCASFNVDSMTWTSHKLTAPGNFSGERFQHAAVLVNSSLFLMFGIDINGDTTNDLAVLNVSDPTNVSFLSNYIFTDLPNTAAIQSGGEISTGAEIGAIVGGVVGAALIAIALYFLCYRKRNKYERNVHSGEDEPQETMMEVDWDQIDQDIYKGRPSTNANLPYSDSAASERLNGNKSSTMLFPANANIALFTTENHDGSTTVSPSVVSDAITPNVAGNATTPSISSKANSFSSPHNLYSPVTPDIEMYHDEKNEALLAKPNSPWN